MISYDVAECGCPLKLFERPTPTPQGTEVLLRVRAETVRMLLATQQAIVSKLRA